MAAKKLRKPEEGYIMFPSIWVLGTTNPEDLLCVDTCFHYEMLHLPKWQESQKAMFNWKMLCITTSAHQTTFITHP
jgi:hypothetical protein